MYTGTYYPKDWGVNMPSNVRWTEGDYTEVWNRNATVEAPSYCVRLIVFEMPVDD